MEFPPLKPGIYQHYKGGKHRLLGVGHHSETLERLVIYQHVLADGEREPAGSIWVRPIGMFLETVKVAGKTVPRFTYLGEE
jgi:hypothetical protein